MCMGKSIVRYGVITALAGGAAVLVAGPDRVRIERAAPGLSERIALVRDFLGKLK